MYFCWLMDVEKLGGEKKIYNEMKQLSGARHEFSREIFYSLSI
jgi:hypothetical protein